MTNVWSRAVLASIGACLGAAGVVAVFTTGNGTGAAACVTVGGVAFIIAMAWDRIAGVGLAGAEVTFAAAANLLEQSADADSRGDTEVAAQYRAQARRVLEAARPVASSYEHVREALPKGLLRTQTLETVVSAARAAAQDFESGQPLVDLFHTGEPGNRIFALAAMEARPDLANPVVVASAIREPKSAFEQYHALAVALRVAPVLDPSAKSALLSAIAEQTFERGGERAALADAARAMLSV